MHVVAKIEHTRICEIGAGKGANSKVFKAQDAQLGAEIVIKELEKAKLHDPAKYFQEAQTMHAASHANVVPIYYACQTNTHILLAMPFFARGSLADRIEKGPIPVREVVRVGLGVLRGLGNIHTAGYVHFDVKPSNVFFNDKDEPMVADFGQSRPVGKAGLATIPRMYWFAHTPEAFLHGVGTALSDIYQVGLLLYRAANGDPVFNEQRPKTVPDLDEAVTKGKFPDRRVFLPHIPPRLRRVIRKALEIDHGDRYQSVSEFAADLGQVDTALDWAVSIDPATGATQWRAITDTGTTLIIDQMPEAHAKWSIQVHTIGISGGMRRKGVADMWESGMSAKEANTHLVGLFKVLGS